jgi:hypothetical protein
MEIYEWQDDYPPLNVGSTCRAVRRKRLLIPSGSSVGPDNALIDLLILFICFCCGCFVVGKVCHTAAVDNRSPPKVVCWCPTINAVTICA